VSAGSGVHVVSVPCRRCNGYGQTGDEYITRVCTNCDGEGRVTYTVTWRPADASEGE